jgi:hypothetical protein
MTRTFRIGVHIWFILHYEDGKVVGLEEHDWREGGSIRLPDGLTWEEYFVSEARSRASGEGFKDQVEVHARTFLASGEKEFNVL